MTLAVMATSSVLLDPAAWQTGTVPPRRPAMSGPWH